MKKLLTKIKLGLATLWIVLISFSSKTMWWNFEDTQRSEPVYEPIQAVYWVPRPTSPISHVLNAVQRLTAIAIFIIWIVNFIRIMRTNDKDLKNKRIKNTIIEITILVVILIATLIISTLLLGK